MGARGAGWGVLVEVEESARVSPETQVYLLGLLKFCLRNTHRTMSASLPYVREGVGD